MSVVARTRAILTTRVTRDHKADEGLGSPVSIVRHIRGGFSWRMTVSSTLISPSAVAGSSWSRMLCDISVIVISVSSSTTAYWDCERKPVRKEGTYIANAVQIMGGNSCRRLEQLYLVCNWGACIARTPSEEEVRDYSQSYGAHQGGSF